MTTNSDAKSNGSSNGASNGEKKSKKSSAFRAIDKAIMPKTGGAKGAAKRALAALASGKVTVKRKDKESGEKKPVDRPLRPGKTVSLVLAALRGGITVDDIAKAAPDLCTRFDWKAAKDAIMTAGSEAKVADLSGYALLFGLIEETDRVVASEPEVAEPPKAVARKSGNGKASARA